MPETALMTGVAAKRCASPVEVRVAAVALGVLVLLISSDMLAGPLRYYLAKAGLEALIYLPKAICLLFVLHETITRPPSRPFFCIVLIVLCSSAVGMLNGAGISCQLFSVYLMAPFFFGAVAAGYLHQMEKEFVRFMAVVFLVTAAGVFIDVCIDFPWKGFVYSVGGTDIEGSREWSTMGLERVAGFARMSAAAAFFLVCSGVFLFGYCRRWTLKLPVLLTAVPAVLVTTNKAGIGGILLGLASLALVRFPRLLRLCVFSLAAAGMLLPLSTLVRTYELNVSDPISLLLLVSFEDRLINTWPGFFAAVSQYGNPVTGAGFGAVGSVAKYFSGGGREALAVADNFPLYLYGIFGIASVLLLFYLARVTLKLFRSENRLNCAVAPVMVACLAASLTTDIVEAQVFALFLGAAVVLPSLETGRRVTPDCGDLA